MSLQIEICIDSVESAAAAEFGGASRVELCNGLLEGGTTPSAGMIEVIRERAGIKLHVLIRPRGGDFCYCDDEVEVMLRDIALARRLGADGVALGLLNPDGSVDEPRTGRLVEAARPLNVTFHRAFDMTRNETESLETLIRIGVDRVLTSGRARTAIEGIPTIAGLVRQSAGRIAILAGGGIDEGNVRRIVTETAVAEIHLTAGAPREGRMLYRNDSVSFRKPLPDDEYIRSVADSARIAQIIKLCDGL